LIAAEETLKSFDVKFVMTTAEKQQRESEIIKLRGENQALGVAREELRRVSEQQRAAINEFEFQVSELLANQRMFETSEAALNLQIRQLKEEKKMHDSDSLKSLSERALLLSEKEKLEMSEESLLLKIKILSEEMKQKETENHTLSSDKEKLEAYTKKQSEEMKQKETENQKLSLDKEKLEAYTKRALSNVQEKYMLAVLCHYYIYQH
jgi:hypothetical protein